MKHFHYTKIKNEDVPAPANKVKVRWLINEKTGAPNFAMRRFEIAPFGNTPYHAHEWEHEVYVLEGNAVATKDDGSEVALKPGDVVLVEPNEKHNFKNTGNTDLIFLCLIPL
jgi:quercetin dioxygenase-like cupin family protein